MRAPFKHSGAPLKPSCPCIRLGEEWEEYNKGLLQGHIDNLHEYGRALSKHVDSLKTEV